MPHPAPQLARSPVEDGDLRAFAQALVALARRIARERQAVVQSPKEPPERKAA